MRSDQAFCRSNFREMRCLDDLFESDISECHDQFVT